MRRWEHNLWLIAFLVPFRVGCLQVGGASDERSGADHPIKVFHSSDSDSSSIATHVSNLSATIAVEGPLDVRQLQQAIQDAASQLMDTGKHLPLLR